MGRTDHETREGDMDMPEPQYKRVLLKVSGEALAGDWIST